jgi:SAM-dependent methyltransferase
MAKTGNVDFVPADPFAWTELESESFDVVISGQTFEHNPYFWITAAEIARVLVPGGMVALIAPSSGRPHRFPVDCWRFYPDSWAAICQYVGLDLLESYREKKTTTRMVIPGTYWRDAMMIAQKPAHIDYERLAAIVATRTSFPSVATRAGIVVDAYERTHTLATAELLRHPLHLLDSMVPRYREWAPINRMRMLAEGHNTRLAVERGQSRES